MTLAAQKEIFENWLSNHKGLLFKVVRAYAFNADDQDDLFQDICIQVWASVPNFKKQSAVSTWLYRIALNTTFKWIRKEKKFNKQKDQEHPGHILHDAMTESDDRLDWLYNEIKKLDEVDRSITPFDAGWIQLQRNVRNARNYNKQHRRENKQDQKTFDHSIRTI